MDREKVIKGLEHCIASSDCRGCSYFKQIEEDGNLCALRADALALLKEQEWNILTEDANGLVCGLPGDDGTYLMTDGKDIWIDDYVDGVDDGVWLDSGRDIREIKAWMYMPELPN
jgi:hypothetical protein